MGFKPKTKREQLVLAQTIAFIIAIIIAIAYFLLPIDIVPDVIPVIGWTDDISIGIGALLISSLFTRSLVEERSE